MGNPILVIRQPYPMILLGIETRVAKLCPEMPLLKCPETSTPRKWMISNDYRSIHTDFKFPRKASLVQILGGCLIKCQHKISVYRYQVI